VHLFHPRLHLNPALRTSPLTTPRKNCRLWDSPGWTWRWRRRACCVRRKRSPTRCRAACWSSCPRGPAGSCTAGRRTRWERKRSSLKTQRGPPPLLHLFICERGGVGRPGWEEGLALGAAVKDDGGVVRDVEEDQIDGDKVDEHSQEHHGGASEAVVLAQQTKQAPPWRGRRADWGMQSLV